MTSRTARPTPPVAALSVGALVFLAVAGLAISALGDTSPSGTPMPSATQSPDLVPGGITPGGSAWPAATPTPTPTASPTPTPTPTPTPSPTPTPPPALDIEARVQVCRQVEGGRCIDEVDRVREPGFSVLVTFSDSNAGDRFGVRLEGPRGQVVDGGSYPVRGGAGAAWSTFTRPLERGDWIAIGTRNGEEIARTRFEVR